MRTAHAHPCAHRGGDGIDCDRAIHHFFLLLFDIIVFESGLALGNAQWPCYPVECAG